MSWPEDRAAVDPLEVVRLRDPYGVLSVYVDADPREQASSRPAWIVAAENGLSEVRERVKSDGDRPRWTAVFERLERLEAELATLLDPRQPGRGRALFATIDGGAVHRVSVQVPLENHVSLDEAAYLIPLLVALDRGRPAGLVVVSQAAAVALEQHLGVVRELTTIALEPDTSDWREMKGPAAANPALAQHGAPQRDLFDRRLGEHRGRLLEGAATRLVELAAQRSWDRVVVAGDGRLGPPLAEAFGAYETDVSVVDRTLHGISPSEIGAALAGELDEANRRREDRLVARARNAALSGGAGALGLADVLTALADGRVDRLLVAEGREYRGMRSSDGILVPEGVVPPGVAAHELAPVPSLTTHMIEQALAIDARVTPLSATGAAALAEHDGIAALLRW
ncbi:MAG TPA: VLRF1 family aeRF1-type release factor [Gaiellaceae bacterium]|nr:VLRF1 family aeRF1-type release factor [Gaiellaceae bacterium]